MNLLNNDELIKRLTQKLRQKELTYKQYLHHAICKTGPCEESPGKSRDVCCAPFVWCIHASDKLHTLPKHPNCDCCYVDVPIRPVGTISKRRPSPDLWLKMYGRLPDYYITKTEAEKLGWAKGKNLAHFAPGKMIGGEIYFNDKHILPEKEGRIWFECDIDYESGKRKSERLFYSNDGLMFYSPNHLYGEVKVYWIK